MRLIALNTDINKDLHDLVVTDEEKVSSFMIFIGKGIYSHKR